MLTPYGRPQWLTIIVLAILAGGAAGLFQLWWLLALVVVLALMLLSFFRDPRRIIPSERNLYVSPCDGRVSSIHTLDHFEPLGEGALCVRVFLSVLDVHINRAPCHGRVRSIDYKPGKFTNALNPQSADENENSLMVLVHPTRQTPVAAVRQIAGAIARRIVNASAIDEVLQRGQRYGMIKFGSTTELYIPLSLGPEVKVTKGQYVYGGKTVLAAVRSGDAPLGPG